MKRLNKLSVVLIAIYCIICSLFPCISYGQSSLSVSTPMIWSDITVKDNWTPSTAPFYKEYLSGSALGYGLNLTYSFQPKFLIRDKHFLINFGVGYFIQKFDIRRPFDYASQFDLIYRTDSYAYYSWNWVVGLEYNYTLNKYRLSANLSYSQSYSFKQKYTPTSGDIAQVNENKIDFGKMLSLSVGVNRYLGNRFSMGLYLVIPISTRWRNDKIFRDDPKTFYKPDSSLGLSISAAYHLKEKHQP